MDAKEEKSAAEQGAQLLDLSFNLVAPAPEPKALREQLVEPVPAAARLVPAHGIPITFGHQRTLPQLVPDHLFLSPIPLPPPPPSVRLLPPPARAGAPHRLSIWRSDAASEPGRRQRLRGM
ncbi:hypothetical protein JOB18_032535 [Solea senegalensis]|uniref:Uncharacterized protein n=1 Tax=Solea senegalensis TaxID=28829 RepID=A0AAV6SU50_SOLSE|nr:hypothetical protein JOB18_032535 [Solea senegalensis]